jgi:hypothetical protein
MTPVQLIVQMPSAPDSIEDGGRAMITQPEILSEGDEEFFIRLQSWAETRVGPSSHELLRSLLGKRLRITIEEDT